MPWREGPFNGDGPTYLEIFGNVERATEEAFQSTRNVDMSDKVTIPDMIVDLFGDLSDWQSFGLGTVMLLVAVWLPFLLITPLPDGYLFKWYGVPILLTVLAISIGLVILGINFWTLGWKTIRANIFEKKNGRPPKDWEI